VLYTHLSTSSLCGRYHCWHISPMRKLMLEDIK
jgi:hypothetical protein